MSIHESETVVPLKRNQPVTTPVDEAGQSIVALLGRAADTAKEDCARAMDLAHRLTFQLREADERARALEAEAAHFRDRALRAEEWLQHIHKEVEQTFFQNNKQGAPPRQPGKNRPKKNGSA